MRNLILPTMIFALLFNPIFAQANITGTHMQNFNPTTNSLDFVTVQSTKTLAPGTFQLGFWSNYAFNSLPFFKAPLVPNTQKFDEPNDKLLSADFNIGLGLSDIWDVGLSLPFVLDQSIDRNAQLGSFDETGLTEVRLNTKVRIYQSETWAAALVGSVNFDRIKNNPFSGSNPGPTWNLEAIVDRTIAPGLLWAFNLGYRLRDEGTAIADSGTTPMPDQLIYSTALSYWYEQWKSLLILELYGSSPLHSSVLPTDRARSNLEILAGIKHEIYPKMLLNGGVTTEVYHGLATPDFRIYLGLTWLVGPVSERAPLPEPPPPAPVIVETEIEEPPSEVIVLHSINFHIDNDEMTAKSRQEFQPTIAKIKNNAQVLRKIIVEGHTDSTGTDAYNLGLSQRRANSVLSVLRTGLGNEVQLQAVGKGESRPIDRNDTDKGRAQNRRVELKIYRNK